MNSTITNAGYGVWNSTIDVTQQVQRQYASERAFSSPAISTAIRPPVNTNICTYSGLLVTVGINRA